MTSFLGEEACRDLDLRIIFEAMDIDNDDTIGMADFVTVLLGQKEHTLRSELMTAARYGHQAKDLQSRVRNLQRVRSVRPSRSSRRWSLSERSDNSDPSPTRTQSFGRYSWRQVDSTPSSSTHQSPGGSRLHQVPDQSGLTSFHMREPDSEPVILRTDSASSLDFVQITTADSASSLQFVSSMRSEQIGQSEPGHSEALAFESFEMPQPPVLTEAQLSRSEEPQSVQASEKVAQAGDNVSEPGSALPSAVSTEPDVQGTVAGMPGAVIS